MGTITSNDMQNLNVYPIDYLESFAVDHRIAYVIEDGKITAIVNAE